MAFRPRRATLQQSGSANATDEFKGKPFLRKMRRVFERCLNKPFTEESLLPQHQQDPTMTGGTAANVPVDGWRVPRTLTTLSWADGSLGRGYITYRESDGVSEKARHRLNQELEPWLFIAEPQQRSHIWSAESFMHYLDFLAQEVRERRKALHLKHTDAALIICDNVILTGDTRDCSVPGGFGANGAPNDGFHQLSLEDSIRADAWALKSLGEYESLDDIFCSMEALEEARQRQPGAMKAILDLAEKPSIQTHTTEDVHQMREARSSPMPGEQNVLWAIQAEGVESRQLLPSWMASPISKEIYKWGDERQKWNKTLEDRCGKPLTALQSKNYEEWKERRSQLTFLFNKKTHQLVKHIRANANWQKIQEEMLSIRIHLADDLESMRIQAGSGPLYLLLMLRGDVVDTDALPGCLDLGVASGALEALEGENQGPESEDLEEECAEDEAFLQQQEAMQIEEQKVADVEAMADTSDEETVQEVIYAVAHVRGGGELGRDWREEGRYLKVKNRFQDFIAVAETLIALGISEPSTLGAWGESSGGLLVTASVNLRPELFKAMLLYVPFVDAVSTMSDPSIPLTCGEWEEIGNPNQRETYYYMLESFGTA
ncbi:Protease 2 (Oligopeptidase B) (Protease II) [Durusdinium trenchii]|uniref:Prolyl endopeptidase n=1 Tax=Durusdinium trenchii TaxID=1381693 RepID=A0ABP0N4J4_9DINO